VIEIQIALVASAPNHIDYHDRFSVFQFQFFRFSVFLVLSFCCHPEAVHSEGSAVSFLPKTAQYPISELKAA
jgi:hypothetical protein